VEKIIKLLSQKMNEFINRERIKPDENVRFVFTLEDFFKGMLRNSTHASEAVYLGELLVPELYVKPPEPTDPCERLHMYHNESSAYRTIENTIKTTSRTFTNFEQVDLHEYIFKNYLTEIKGIDLDALGCTFTIDTKGTLKCFPSSAPLSPRAPSVRPEPISPRVPSVRPEPVSPRTPSVRPEPVSPRVPSVRPELVSPRVPSVRPERVSSPTPPIADFPMDFGLRPQQEGLLILDTPFQGHEKFRAKGDITPDYRIYGELTPIALETEEPLSTVFDSVESVYDPTQTPTVLWFGLESNASVTDIYQLDVRDLDPDIVFADCQTMGELSLFAQKIRRKVNQLFFDIGGSTHNFVVVFGYNQSSITVQVSADQETTSLFSSKTDYVIQIAIPENTQTLKKGLIVDVCTRLANVLSPILNESSSNIYAHLMAI
jgi:hypothetical protein